MSDFFHNLVSRSRTPLEAVRPRIASRFEPQPGVLDAAREEALVEEREEQVAESPSRRSRSLVTEPSVAEYRQASEPALLRAEASIPLPTPEDPIDSIPPLGRPQVEPPRVLPVQRESVPSQSSVPAAQAAPLGPLASHETREIHELFHERETRIERELFERVPTLRSEPVTAPPLPARIERILSAAPVPSARRDQKEQPRNVVPEAATEPVIHVSIGRIEVRAVSEPPRVRKENQASTVMGLDEYLRRREKGAAR